MMRTFIFILIALVFCVIQAGVLNAITIFGVTPDIILIFILYIALFQGRRGMWYGFCMGFFVDIYSSSVVGVNALLNTVIGYALGSYSDYVYKAGILSRLIILFGGSLFHDLVILATQKSLSFYSLFHFILPRSVYTTIVGLFIFFLLNKLEPSY
jgi:rod shape-determining protein MreD